MPYLIRMNETQLLLLNHSNNNGVYSQILSSTGLSRPTIISRNPSSNYSATLDDDKNLHILLQPSKEQVIHLHYQDKNVTRNTILEDPKNIYNFSNLKTIHATNQVHLFYTAKKPNEDSYELIHHILCKEDKFETCPILSFSSETLGFRYQCYDGKIFILYGELSDTYCLNIIVYQDNSWTKPIIIKKSTFPIDDFQFCIDNQGRIHIVYVYEKYGRYHLSYKQYFGEGFSDDHSLYSTSTIIYPTIFTYHGGVWINFIGDDKLQMILSMDNGASFSKNVDCSMQTNDLRRCNFLSAPDIFPLNFNCNTIFASLSYPIRSGVISSIDMINFHPDLRPNTELELFIDGIIHTFSGDSPTTNTPAAPQDIINRIKDLEVENNELKQIQENMVQQYNDMAELTKKIQDEGKKWRDKALDLTKELEEDKLKSKTQDQ
ncbi:MAG: hypothetical protein GX366_05010 [Epulopiscium sp.]|nr:hypothetical protein [Candidatus Epulonipiscium sp.]